MDAVAARGRPKEPAKADELSGRQKAAILFMALGPEQSKPLVEELAPEELESIALEIARLEHVPAEVVEAVLTELDRTQHGPLGVARGGVGYARQFLEGTLGPQGAAAVLEAIEARVRENGFHKLREADPKRLAEVLGHEHPQLIAVVLAQLDARLASDIVAYLEPAAASDVLHRIATLGRVSAEVIEAVEQFLASEAVLSLAQDQEVSGGAASVAAILNRMDRSVKKELLDALGNQNGAMLDDIRSQMFVFDDLAALDAQAVKRVLQDVELRELALSLRAANDDVKEQVRSGMSQRARDALDEESEMLGPVRLRDVEAAQAQIVELVRRLEEEGEIEIGGADDDVLV